MKSFGRIAMLVYGIGIFLGGTMGYVSKKSLASLAAGIASLVLMGTAFYLAKTKPKVGYAIGTATAAGLALFFLYRVMQTGKMMPNAMLIGLSVIAVILFGMSAIKGSGGQEVEG